MIRYAVQVNGLENIRFIDINNLLFFRELVPKSYFERYQHNGQHVVNKPTGKVSCCHKQEFPSHPLSVQKWVTRNEFILFINPMMTDIY
jgi:hypothetical protein